MTNEAMTAVEREALFERVEKQSLTFRNGGPVPDSETAVIKAGDLRALLALARVGVEEIREVLQDAQRYVGCYESEHEDNGALHVHSRIDVILSRLGRKP